MAPVSGRKNGPKLRPQDIARAFHLYETEDWCITAIANHLDVSRAAVRYHFRRRGVKAVEPAKIAR